MKGCLLIFLAAAVLAVVIRVSCADGPTDFTGYIVAKEYTPGHMCHDDVKTVSYAVVHVPIVHHTTTHTHTWQPSTFIWFVANKNDIEQFSVDSVLFHSRKCGENVTMKY